MQLTHIFMVGLGGALGAISRVSLSQVLPQVIWGIPVSIMLVNVLGCFLMGLLSAVFAFYGAVGENMRYLVFSGFLGGFTTFSAFALEWGNLQEKHMNLQGILYIVFSVALSLLAFWGGLKIVRVVSEVV